MYCLAGLVLLRTKRLPVQVWTACHQKHSMVFCHDQLQSLRSSDTADGTQGINFIAPESNGGVPAQNPAHLASNGKSLFL